MALRFSISKMMKSQTSLIYGPAVGLKANYGTREQSIELNGMAPVELDRLVTVETLEVD